MIFDVLKPTILIRAQYFKYQNSLSDPDHNYPKRVSSEKVCDVFSSFAYKHIFFSPSLWFFERLPISRL